MIRLLIVAAALVASSATASAAEVVRYQCKPWKAKHIHETAKAKTIAATLKKLGCEVKTRAHNGHVDVKYRCPEWRQLKLKTHEDAHRWEKWLKEYGFTTQHKH
jgi:5-enolpyruvylshikimate-3-phosphate synthase